MRGVRTIELQMEDRNDPDTSKLPRTNNDLEKAFGGHRYHKRRSSGRPGAPPSFVLRGSATRRCEIDAEDLSSADRPRWIQYRAELEERCEQRTARRRFRQDPKTYLEELDNKLNQPRLPSQKK